MAMSTILTKKELLKKVPFREDLIAHFDWDWLLRVSTLEGVDVEFVPERDPLAIFHMEASRFRISNETDWRYSLSWAKTNNHLLTQRAFISFILTQVSLHAVRMKQLKAFKILLLEAYKYGEPRWIDLLAYTLIWFIPRKIRKKIVILINRVFLKNRIIRLGR